ncbi:hypothetical protein LshimejAT787_1602920 [Lyophyllum shimeji]|uniref:Uncharacterized protein n=1 Tax=Lyophyllum shimeji TaxID=47721 RepID=A0A9P3PWN7_LYOSH|nr:hypothetical protein LshimejAT787_1602920 [Lyophyllum shimeji]
MSEPPRTDSVSLPAGKTSGFIERVDSDRTDESPFGSTLATPVDEDVKLFAGIEQRLLENRTNSHGDGATAHLGPQEAAFDAHGLLKIARDGIKLPVGDALEAAPTPSPSLDRVDLTFGQESQTESLNVHISRPRAESIYSQPNVPLPISGETPDVQLEHYPFPEAILDTQSSPAVVVDEKFASSPAGATSEEDFAKTARELFSLLPFAHEDSSFNEIMSVGDLLSSSLANLFPRNLFPSLLRIFLFFPWCLLAGGALLLFPGHLEALIFSPGYAESRRGIRRFAFLADTGTELVSIFIVVLMIFWYAFPTAGVLAIGGIAAQAIYAWQGFEVDRSVPLGEDDRQTLYLVWKRYLFVDALKGLTSTDQGFFATGADDDENAEDEEGL